MSQNPSNRCARSAGSAEDAQFLRGALVFGDIAFAESLDPRPRTVVVDPGHADCLPIFGQGWWRDPVKAYSGDPA